MGDGGRFVAGEKNPQGGVVGEACRSGFEKGLYDGIEEADVGLEERIRFGEVHGGLRGF
jgi:hypothetical protein